MRAIISGAAGFIGPHLCRALLSQGWEIQGVDSFLTGRREDLKTLTDFVTFRFEEADVSHGWPDAGHVDWVLHLASPASPLHYQRFPLETLRAGSTATLHGLELARRTGAAFFLASTSEVYGDPEVHPQPESYWGRVNPVGPRSVYDEAKRFAEAAVMAHGRTTGLPVRIARIFNTYGPGMRADDGRAVPTFISQAMRGESLTVHGDGKQTRSLCYVDDLVSGIVHLLASDMDLPCNLGNPEEVTVLELAERIRKLIDPTARIQFIDRPVDDPTLRCPDISRARQLGWRPETSLDEGLKRTVAWAKASWDVPRTAR